MYSNKQKGIAAVEMAFVLIPMLVLCFGITELGRALYQYNGLVKATRGAARYLSQQGISVANADSIRLNARNFAFCGAYVCTNTPSLVNGLTLDMISVCDPTLCASTHANVATGQGTVSLVSVRINAGDNKFTFNSLVPWVIPNIAFSPISATMASSAN